jgi:3-dehydroquinate dehydratase-1
MGGNFVGEESKRIYHLLAAINSGASFVDLEIETDLALKKRIYEGISESSCQLIISKHYTEFTPEYEDLLDLVTWMKNEEADIMKVVVTPQSVDDCKRVLQLYSLESMDTPLIAFAMGNLGKFSRVSALFLGAPFMYVSQDSGEAAALGQISLSDMRTIVRFLT